MSSSELVLSAVLRSSVVSVLGSCAADPHSSPRLCSFFFNHVYNGYGDHNTSLTFKFLHFFSFFFCSHSRKGGAQFVSQRERQSTPVFYNSEALHITNTIWNTSDYSDRLAGFRMVFVINATKAKKFPTPWASNECYLAAFTFFRFYFCRKCNLVYIAKKLYVMLSVWQHTMHTLPYFCKWVLVIGCVWVHVFLYSLPC
jgi:hypothetical protein